MNITLSNQHNIPKPITIQWSECPIVFFILFKNTTRESRISRVNNHPMSTDVIHSSICARGVYYISCKILVCQRLIIPRSQKNTANISNFHVAWFSSAGAGKPLAPNVLNTTTGFVQLSRKLKWMNYLLLRFEFEDIFLFRWQSSLCDKLGSFYNLRITWLLRRLSTGYGACSRSGAGEKASFLWSSRRCFELLSCGLWGIIYARKTSFGCLWRLTRLFFVLGFGWS